VYLYQSRSDTFLFLTPVVAYLKAFDQQYMKIMSSFMGAYGG
jgi:hypothetical protein